MTWNGSQQTTRFFSFLFSFVGFGFFLKSCYQHAVYTISGIFSKGEFTSFLVSFFFFSFFLVNLFLSAIYLVSRFFFSFSS
ncbi:hypothetical protein QBC44DRAFT_147687 [Cladorrhinum sp. PSN332]|nr:hypothetical protein QBC44DRAFT_147687 [Cladorrhinum sp. PSN332]